MAFGIFSSILMGLSLPIFANLIGNMIDSFSQNVNRYEQGKNAMLLFIYLSGAALVVGMVTSALWNISGGRQATQCRRQYFKNAIRQDIGWFDTQNLNELTNSFGVDTLAFEQAIGEKISILVFLASMVLSGIGLSLFNGWIYSLVIVAYMPLLVLAWTRNVKARQQVLGQHQSIYE